MQTNELLERISKYWQIITFIVALVGYVTFSLYININGFSFIDIDIKQVAGLGLLGGSIIAFILFFSRFNKPLILNLVLASLPSSMLMLLNYVSIKIVMVILMATIMMTLVFLDIDETKSKNHLAEPREKSSDIEKFYDKIFLWLAPLCVLIFVDWSYVLLFIVSAVFIVSNEKYYKYRFNINPFQLIMFSLLISFCLALIINQNGLKVANFEKKNITFNIGDIDINATLVYQNQSSFFIHSSQKMIEIQKSNIKYAEYSEYSYEKNNLYELIANSWLNWNTNKQIDANKTN